MTRCTVAGGLSAAAADALKANGFELIPPPENELLDKRISHHADLYLCLLRDTIVASSALSGSLTDKTDKRIITVDYVPSSPYPCDCGLNCAASGGYFIHGKSCHEELLELAVKAGLEPIRVKQGYVKCSCAVLPDAVITDDESIYRAVKGRLDALLVSKGSVLLSGMDCGFIGGASGFSDGKLYFYGSLDSHPDAEKIRSFAASHGAECVSLTTEPLNDAGSIIFI